MNRVPTIDEYLKIPTHPLRQTGGRCKVDKSKCDSAHPLVTVFTAVKNRKSTLPKTITSVLSQSYPNIEYIVIDGASTDGTLDVLRKFDDKINLWISEPDCGTSDAFNKAISLAQGELIFWLSSDDWIGPGFIVTAVKMFLKTGVDFVFGNMVMYKNEDPVMVCEGDKDYVKSIMTGNPCFNYPSMVIKKECFRSVGLFDMTLKYAGDYEWLLRVHQHGGKGHCENSLIVYRGVGGLGESHIVPSMLEQIRILKQYGLPKTKVLATSLYYFMRIGLGSIARLLLPPVVYRKIRAVVCRN